MSPNIVELISSEFLRLTASVLHIKTLADFVRGDYHQKFQTDNDAVFLNQTRPINNHNSWQMELKQIRETESTQKLLLWTIDGDMGYRFQYSAPDHTLRNILLDLKTCLNRLLFLSTVK